MSKDPNVKGQTPSQTVGPFFAYGMSPEQYGYPFKSLAGATVATDNEPGEHLRLAGRVLDGNGVPVDDAVIELWQADAQGRYAHPADPRRPNTGFTGFGRTGTGTDARQRFWFDTVKPGVASNAHAPHMNLIVFMRGLLNHVYTRVYFSDEATLNATDPVLQLVPKARRQTLIAARHESARGVEYLFDIRMQGDNATVFFDV
jgi:protocatechuate 3,4-dioxygenase, alpha subunit